MANHTLAAIAEEVGGELQGNPDQIIERVRGVEEAARGDICVVIDRRYTSESRHAWSHRRSSCRRVSRGRGSTSSRSTTRARR